MRLRPIGSNTYNAAQQLLCNAATMKYASWLLGSTGLLALAQGCVVNDTGPQNLDCSAPDGPRVVLTQLDGTTREYPELADAQSAANATTLDLSDAAGTLRFCPGKYHVNLHNIQQTLTIEGVGAARSDTELVGDAKSNANYGERAVLQLTGETAAVLLKNLTIRDGISPWGGGISSRKAGQRIAVDNVLFQDNTSVGTGQALGGAIFAAGELTVTNSDFVHNETYDGGGAIYALGPLNIGQSHFSQNTSYIGGAVLAFNGPVDILDTEFTENHALSSGGALEINNASAALHNVLAINNRAGLYGGALSAWGSKLAISEATLNANSAMAGGALYFTGVTAMVVDGDIDNNIASSNSYGFENWRGGAMYMTASNVSFSRTTIAANSAGNGYAIYLTNEGAVPIANGASKVTLDNCDFGLNQAPGQLANVQSGAVANHQTAPSTFTPTMTSTNTVVSFSCDTRACSQTK